MFWRLKSFICIPGLMSLSAVIVRGKFLAGASPLKACDVDSSHVVKRAS